MPNRRFALAPGLYVRIVRAAGHRAALTDASSVDRRIEELRAFALTLTQGATAQARRRVMGIQLLSEMPSHPLPVIAVPRQEAVPELDDNLGNIAPAA